MISLSHRVRVIRTHSTYIRRRVEYIASVRIILVSLRRSDDVDIRQSKTSVTLNKTFRHVGDDDNIFRCANMAILLTFFITIGESHLRI